LRSFAAIREKAGCRLVIAGDGPERATLESLARQLLPDGSYVFTGHIDAVERVYSALDIFALPSDTEQMPTSLMEAMAAGLPAVATDVGDVLRMVSAENLPFIVQRDTQTFSDALFRLVCDQADRNRIGDANRAMARAQFEISRMFRDYEVLFSACGGADISGAS
jgi:glycosyltransferase involved in cell wall biosynthesis